MFQLRFRQLAAASALAFSLFVPQGAGAEALPQIVAEALSHHPSVTAAVANKEALYAERKETKAEFFPQINVKGTGGRNFADNATSRGLSVSRGEGYSWLWEGTVTVRQHLWNGFETENRLDAAQARANSSYYNIADVQEALALRTVISFLDVLRAEETLAQLEAHGDKVSGYIERIRAMVDEGVADESMIVQASDIRAQLQNSIVNAQSQLQASLAAFNEVVGRTPESDLVKPVPQLDVIPETSEDAVSYAMANHPVIKASALKREALEHDEEAARAAIFPDFTGELSYYERDQADIIGGEVRDAKAVVRMNWDYGLGGSYKARVNRTRYRQLESEAKLAETKRQIEKDIRVAYSDRQAALAQLTVQRERLALNRSLLDTYESQFEAARVNLLQLMQTDNALFNTRMGLINGEYRLLASQYAILASMGRLIDALNLVPVKNDN